MLGATAEAAHDGNAEKGALPFSRFCFPLRLLFAFASLIDRLAVKLMFMINFSDFLPFPSRPQSGYAGPSSVLESEKSSDVAAKRPKLSDPGAVKVHCCVSFVHFFSVLSRRHVMACLPSLPRPCCRRRIIPPVFTT